MRSPHVLLLLALACGACDEPISPPDPASVRFGVETAGYLAWRAQPIEKGVPSWRRTDTVIQHDERDADRFVSGVALDRAVPEGARSVQTAIGAWMGPKYWIEEDRVVRVELELVEGGAKRTLVSEDLSVHALLAGGWHAWQLPIDPPARRGARLVARALPGPVPPPKSPDETPAVVDYALQRPWFDVGAAKKPNVLVLSIDTLRADHLGCYGYARGTSPNIDALAAKGVLFENCTAPAPWTLPSYGSLFTSRSPIVHRAGINRPRENAWGSDRDVPEEEAYEALRSDLPTWAEAMRANGWTTAGFHSNPFLRGGTGIERGFERWTYYWMRANAAVELSGDWIASRKSAPWFAFVHVMDPHQPYSPPAPWDTKWSSRTPEDVWAATEAGAATRQPLRVDAVRAMSTDATFRADYVGLYDGEIGYTDEQIGLLLARLEREGELADTIVVLHSDHGEEFWEHGGYEHGHALIEEVVHVPLIVCWPGHLPAGVRVKDRVSLIDVMPTVLSLVGAPKPNRIEGVDLSPTWSGRALGARAVLSDTMLYGSRESKALYQAGEKLVQRSGDAPRYYDLAVDPHEARDLATERQSQVEALVRRLQDRLKALKADSKPSGLSDFDPVRRQLGDGGYFEGGKK